MTQPLIVSLPHSVGKAEAIRRLKSGLTRVGAEYGQFIEITEEIWSEDRLALQVTVLKRHCRATIDVGEDSVRLEVILPWLLSRLARSAQAIIQQKGTLMLEKK